MRLSQASYSGRIKRAMTSITTGSLAVNSVDTPVLITQVRVEIFHRHSLEILMFLLFSVAK